MVLFAEKRCYLSRKNCLDMLPIAEKSKMSLVFRKQKCPQKTQKCPLNRQICPVGYLIKSVFFGNHKDKYNNKSLTFY